MNCVVLLLAKMLSMCLLIFQKCWYNLLSLISIHKMLQLVPIIWLLLFKLSSLYDVVYVIC